jgi:hypothetical protein
VEVTDRSRVKKRVRTEQNRTEHKTHREPNNSREGSRGVEEEIRTVIHIPTKAITER